MKRKKKKKPPKNPTAWCALHHRLMNDLYISRRGCVMRRCKHLNWMDEKPGAGPPGNGTEREKWEKPPALHKAPEAQPTPGKGTID